MPEFFTTAIGLRSVNDITIRSARRITVRSLTDRSWLRQIVNAALPGGTSPGEPERDLSIYTNGPVELVAAITRVKKARLDVWTHPYTHERVFDVLCTAAISVANDLPGFRLSGGELNKHAILEHMLLPCGIVNNDIAEQDLEAAQYLELMDDTEKRQLIEEAIAIL